MINKEKSVMDNLDTKDNHIMRSYQFVFSVPALSVVNSGNMPLAIGYFPVRAQKKKRLSHRLAL
jgi:hypothetical protein